MKSNPIVALYFCLFSVSAFSQSPQQCVNIVSDKDRLACYDALFAQSKTARSAEQQPTQSTHQQTNSTIPAAKTTEFGLERRDSTPEFIESKAVGQFSSWQKKMKIRLENGQVWQITQSSKVYFKTENPQVRIEKGALGSFFLHFYAS